MFIPDIPPLLDRWQTLTQSVVTPEQRLLLMVRLQQLAEREGASERLSDRQVAAALAPLLASQDSQLRQFKQLYIDELNAQRRRQLTRGEMNPDAAGYDETSVDQSAKNVSRLTRFVLALAALLISALLLWFTALPIVQSSVCGSKAIPAGVKSALLCPAELAPVITERSGQPVVADPVVEPETTAYLDPIEVPVSLPERFPEFQIDRDRLPDVPNTALRNIIALTVLLALAGLLLPLLTRLILKQQMSRWPTRQQTLDSLSLEGLKPLHLAPAHDRFLPPLRYQASGPERLDVRRTVAASSERGLPQLKYGARLRRRELVFVIPCFREGDWRTEYFLSLAQELHERNVQVLCYYYQHSPRYLSPTRHTSTSTQRLSALLRQLDRCTWVFCVNASAVFHEEFGHLLDWTDALVAQPNRLLLCDVPMSRRQAAALADTHIQLVEFSDRVGPQALLEQLSAPEPDSGTQVYARASYRLPDSLEHLGDPSTAHLMPEKAEIIDLMRWLKSKLGKQGFALLSATAVYPDANWRLARLLAWKLSDAGNDGQNLQDKAGIAHLVSALSRLIGRGTTNSKPPQMSLNDAHLRDGSLQLFRRLAQLPWARQGRFPLWLRNALVDELGSAAERQVADLFDAVLQPVERGQSTTDYRLTVDKPEHGFGALWRYFTQASPEQDVLFLSVMGRGLLGFRLPAAVSRLFRKGMMSFGQWWPSLVASCVLAVLGGIGSLLAYALMTDQLGSDYQFNKALTTFHAQNASVLVALGYQPLPVEANDSPAVPADLVPAYVKGFEQLLQRLGYQVSLEVMGESNTTQNRVAASPVHLDRLVDALDYHTYGLPIRAEARESQTDRAGAGSTGAGMTEDASILLIHQVQSGQIFRDTLKRGDLVALQPRGDDGGDEAIVTPEGVREALREELEELNRAEQPASVESEGYIDPDMVIIPAGSFMMGSETLSREGPVHQVTVPAFELARNELSWAEWQLCEDAGGCTEIERPTFFSDIEATEQGRHPVVNVNINSVNEYITWISEQTGRTYRLPSEAEWEYAARAGTTTEHSWGDDIGSNRANCDGCGSEWDNQSTAPVGSFSPNPFDLHDMHGNVWEWVADCWHDNYEGAPTDGSAWVDNCTDGERRPLRGGSWGLLPVVLRAAGRGWSGAVNAYYSVGFRLARTTLP